MRFIGFIGPSYTLQSVNADAQRCINLYPELNEVGTGKEKEVAALVGTPGLRLLVTLGSGPVRGIYAALQSGVLYAVSGNTLYSISSSWVATSLGTLNTTTGPVSFADNGTQLVVVDGTYGYYVTLATGAFAQITDPDFLGATQVTFQDSYLIFNKPNSQQFFLSDLTSVNFSALNIASSEALPDLLLGVLSNQRYLYLFGTNSIEIWYDSGDTFPFTRVQGAFIPVGTVSAFSIGNLQDSIIWLARDGQGRGIVYRASGFQSQRISTHAIEEVIAQIGDLSTARAWTYTQRGHGFYCLNLPGAATTWVFDTTTNLWHERAALKTADGSFGRHQADCHAFAYNTNVVGDYSTGRVYALDPATYSDNGTEIPRVRAAPHLTKGLKRLFFDSFQLDMETGVGLDGGVQGSDPKAILQWSDDGGHNWSSERWVSVGKIGQTKARARWTRLGSSRDRVFRVRITDKVKVTMLGAELGVTEGNH